MIDDSFAAMDALTRTLAQYVLSLVRASEATQRAEDRPLERTWPTATAPPGSIPGSPLTLWMAYAGSASDAA
jgi:hypothetical protein